MIKTVAMVVVLLLAAILIFAATRPDTFRVERSESIQAPPEKIFPLINDFQSWRAWSPRFVTRPPRGCGAPWHVP